MTDLWVQAIVASKSWRKQHGVIFISPFKIFSQVPFHQRCVSLLQTVRLLLLCGCRPSWLANEKFGVIFKQPHQSLGSPVSERIRWLPVKAQRESACNWHQKFTGLESLLPPRRLVESTRIPYGRAIAKIVCVERHDT